MISKIVFMCLCACSSQQLVIPEQVAVEPIENVMTLPPTTAEVTRIYFIRNGETEYSAKDIHGTKCTSGKSPHIALNARGVEQARHLGEALSLKIGDGVIYTPPAVRAEQTASWMLFPEKGLVMGGTSEGLFEVGMGVWEGKPKDQSYKEEYQKWKDLSAQEKYVTPKVATGESYDEAASRAFASLEAILDKEQGKTIFVISGENLLNALAMRWTHPSLSQEPGSDLPMLPMADCDLFLVEVPYGQSVEKGSLKMLLLAGAETS